MKLTLDSYFLFSGGEVHCKLGDPNKMADVVCLDYTMNGFMALCQHKQVLDRKNICVDITYPYFPYSRQDRVTANREPFSLKIFCELLNTQDFFSVTTYDPHSDVIGALVKNIRIIEQHTIAKDCLPKELLDNPDVMFVSPDAGAYKKLSKLITNDYRIVIGTKMRGTDGSIIRTSVYSPCELKGKTCVIVDDICDGGRTFIELAKALRHKGATKIILYVTHGIFSKGFFELFDSGIDHIYTTNSFNNSAKILEMHKSKITIKDVLSANY